MLEIPFVCGNKSAVCSSLGKPGTSSNISLFGNAVSEARTSKCVIVLLPEVILGFIILDILELSNKKDRWPVKGTG